MPPSSFFFNDREPFFQKREKVVREKLTKTLRRYLIERLDKKGVNSESLTNIDDLIDEIIEDHLTTTNEIPDEVFDTQVDIGGFRNIPVFEVQESPRRKAKRELLQNAPKELKRILQRLIPRRTLQSKRDYKIERPQTFSTNIPITNESYTNIPQSTGPQITYSVSSGSSINLDPLYDRIYHRE